MHDTYERIHLNFSFLSVPSAPPSSVMISGVNTSSMTIQWNTVVCIHQNGKILGYSVKYGVQGSNSTKNVNVSGGENTVAIISGLTSITTYTIEVAAMNSAGIGNYSAPVIVITHSKSI